jgi:Ca2+-binding RTX toxin-like protein
MKSLVLAFGLVVATAWPAHASLPADASDYCPKRYYTVVSGTAGADAYTFPESPVPWVCYFALGDADRITGSTWIDTAILGPGNDTANMRGGADSVDGNGGSDVIDGGAGGPTVLFGGYGNDTLTGGGAEDDLFGGEVCSETTYWGFTGNPSTAACGNGGSDHLYGAGGNDWLWESNSDNTGDGSYDYLDGGAGNDYCAVESTDTAVNCETVVILTSPGG